MEGICHSLLMVFCGDVRSGFVEDSGDYGVGIASG